MAEAEVEVEVEEYSALGLTREEGEKLDTELRRELVAIRRVLESTLRPPGIIQWMTRPNGYLQGEIPKNLFVDKSIGKVREAAEAYVRGYYL